MKLSRWIPVCGALIAATLAASAAPIHALGDGDTSGFTSGGVDNYVRGWRFQANANVNVLELGASTPHLEGEAFSVVLWNFGTQTLLAQSDFISDGSNNWQWAALPSAVSLTSGSQYIVAVYSAIGHYYFQSFPSGSPWLPTGDIQYLDMRYANSASVSTFPTNVLNNYQYGVPDIGYELAGQVPEPSTFLLAGLGLAAAGLLGRRSRS